MQIARKYVQRENIYVYLCINEDYWKVLMSSVDVNVLSVVWII